MRTAASREGREEQEGSEGREGAVRAGLRRRLLALGYHAFARCLCLLLERLGYEDARPAGRTGWKGFNTPGGGGYDIEAALPAGLTRRRVVVRAKQFDALPVFQRQVDELRGACLRTGADEALLVTTSAFSPVALRAERDTPVPLAPVRLVGGDELLGLMLARRVGVWEEAGETPDEPRRLGLDGGFFDGLERRYPGAGRPEAHGDTDAKESANGSHAAPSWRVTVQVQSPAEGTQHRKGRR